MRQLILALALTFAEPAGAEDPWTVLSGEEIQNALAGRVVQYQNAWQEFRHSGATLYNAGRDSWGYWRVEGNRYCSQWPPSDLWACYGLERRGDAVRFVGAAGDTTEGVFRGNGG